MQFSENSRVWIYQADRQLSDEETQQIQQHLNAFAAQWTAHNNQLKAAGEVRYNRFLILTSTNRRPAPADVLLINLFIL